jgi:hypothetical protein
LTANSSSSIASWGRVHGDHRGRGHAVADIFEHVGIHHVERAAGGLAHLVIGHHLAAEAVGRVEGREIDPGLVEPLGIEPRQHAGHSVDGLGAGVSTPKHRFSPKRARLGDGFVETFDEVRAAHLFQEIGQHEAGFDDMAVAVDDRIIELLAPLR